MPLFDKEVTATRAWGLWKIEETEGSLHQLCESEPIPKEITHPEKRLEFLAVRVLVKNLLLEWGLGFQGLTKNQYGKPFLKNSSHHISLSHSYPFVTAILDTEKTVGIDLEHSKAKLLNIAPRMLHATELNDASSDITKLCVYWCAKEAMLKVYGKKDLIFAENLLINPFVLKEEGDLVGRIIVEDSEARLSLHYRLFRDFAIVYSQ